MFSNGQYKNVNWLTVVFWASFSATIVSILAVVPSSDFNWGAESLSFGAFQRIGQGLAHVSHVGELPLFLSPYSPYFYWLFSPIVKWLPIDNPLLFAAGLRGLMILTHIVLFIVLYRTCALVTGVHNPFKSLVILYCVISFVQFSH